MTHRKRISYIRHRIWKLEMPKATKDAAVIEPPDIIDFNMFVDMLEFENDRLLSSGLC